MPKTDENWIDKSYNHGDQRPQADAQRAVRALVGRIQRDASREQVCKALHEFFGGTTPETALKAARYFHELLDCHGVEQKKDKPSAPAETKLRAVS